MDVFGVRLAGKRNFIDAIGGSAEAEPVFVTVDISGVVEDAVV